MVGLLLHRMRSLRLVEDPDFGHTGNFEFTGPVGVLLPLRPALIVSGEPALVVSIFSSTATSSPLVGGLSSSDALRLGLAPRQERRASRATRWQTPSGGAVPGNVLNGVTVGS